MAYTDVHAPIPAYLSSVMSFYLTFHLTHYTSHLPFLGQAKFSHIPPPTLYTPFAQYILSSPLCLTDIFSFFRSSLSLNNEHLI